MSREFQDRCIQQLFVTKENCFELIRLMSAELAADLDQTSVEILNPVVVGDNEEKAIEDVVFRVRSRGQPEQSYGFLVVLAHQSYREQELFDRMLRAYVYLQDREKRAGSSTGVKQNFWPIVIYTGQSRWPMPSLRERRAKELRKQGLAEEKIEKIVAKLPDFEFDYLDLAAVNLDELIAQRSEVSCVLGFMGGRREVEKAEKIFDDILTKISDDQGIRGCSTNLLALVFYLLRHSHLEAVCESFRTKLKQKLSIAEEKDVLGKVKTWAEQLEKENLAKGREQGLVQGREEGRVQGREQGRLESLRESIIKLVSRRFPEVSEAEIKKRLETQTELEKLQSILDQVFQWTSLDDVWTTFEAENS